MPVTPTKTFDFLSFYYTTIYDTTMDKKKSKSIVFNNSYVGSKLSKVDGRITKDHNKSALTSRV